MKFGDLVRAKAGTTHIYEVPLDKRQRMANHVQSYATRTNADVKLESINGFSAVNHAAIYLLKVTVKKSGEARKKRGRPFSKDTPTNGA